MNANWYSNLTTYWSKIEEETTQTLRLVRDDFQRGGMSLNSKFKEDFVQETNKRIMQTFDRFLNQNPINETTAAVNREDGVMDSQPVVESIPDEVHERIAVKTTELAHELEQNRSITDSSTATSTAIFLQAVPISTPFLDTIDGCETNPPLCPTLQTIDSPMNESIGPNHDTPTVDAMLVNASKLTPQSDQSQAIDANESDTEGDANAFATEKSNAAMPPDAIGPAISRLDDIFWMDVLDFETEIDLPIDANASEVMDLDIEQAASGARDNESTNQLAEGLVSNCEDEGVELSLEVTRDHIERNASEQGVGNQRQKRKITDVTTSAGNARKRRKTGLRTTLKTIAESSSGDLALNGSCNQADSTSSQPEKGGGLSGAARQIKSTSNVRQVAKERGGRVRRSGEGGSKGHQCAFCEHVAPCEVALKAHTRKHTGDKPFKCEVCEKRFTSGRNLKRHMITHLAEKPFKCKVCAKKYTAALNLREHMKIHVKEFSFNCRICLQGFNEEKAKKTHEKSCNRRLYECYLCKYSHEQRAKVIAHMRTHTGDKPFKCEVCEKGFSQRCNLKTHMLFHLAENPFKCKVCTKKFTTVLNLREHMKIHVKEFSFHCRICLQGLNEEKAKKAHENRCNRRRFECYLCKYSSFVKQTLVKHMRTHIDDKPFCCSHCSKRFTQKSNLYRHTRRYHDETK